MGIFIGSSELPTTVIEFKLEEYYNNIYRNTVIDNYECGIKMCLVSNTNIFNNNVTNNKIGVLIDAPINVETTDNNIYENNIMNNKVGVAFTLAIGFPFFNKLSSAKNNKIYNNNFIGNKNNADNLDKNIWESNYWDDWIGLRFKILGFLPYKVDIGLFSFAFDWHPASEPYDIEV